MTIDCSAVVVMVLIQQPHGHGVPRGVDERQRLVPFPVFVMVATLPIGMDQHAALAHRDHADDFGPIHGVLQSP
jgi:hypothetical protein